MNPNTPRVTPLAQAALLCLLLAVELPVPAHAAHTSYDQCIGYNTGGAYDVTVTPVLGLGKVGVQEEALVAEAWQYLCNQYAEMLVCTQNHPNHPTPCSAENADATDNAGAYVPWAPVLVEHMDEGGNVTGVDLWDNARIIVEYYIPPQG